MRSSHFFVLTPQTGYMLPSGKSSNEVSGFIPFFSSPLSGSYIQPQAISDIVQTGVSMGLKPVFPILASPQTEQVQVFGSSSNAGHGGIPFFGSTLAGS